MELMELTQWMRRNARVLSIQGALLLASGLASARLVWGDAWPRLVRASLREMYMEDRFQQVDVLLRRRDTVLKERTRMAGELRTATSENVAESLDSLGWASRLVEVSASAAGAKVQGIIELKGRDSAWADESAGRAFDACAVRVDLSGTFGQVVSIVNVAENQNPYLCLASLTTTEVPQAGENQHRVSLVFELPVWARGGPAQPIRESMRLD
jgi:hypothetical protein